MCWCCSAQKKSLETAPTDKLSAAIEHEKQVDQSCKLLSNDIEMVHQKLSNILDSMKNREELKRRLTDNLELMHHKEELELVNRKIRDLRGSVG